MCVSDYPVRSDARHHIYRTTNQIDLLPAMQVATGPKFHSGLDQAPTLDQVRLPPLTRTKSCTLCTLASENTLFIILIRGVFWFYTVRNFIIKLALTLSHLCQIFSLCKRQFSRLAYPY